MASSDTSAAAAVVRWLKELRTTHPVLTADGEAELVGRLRLEPLELRNELVLRNLGPAVVLLRQDEALRGVPIADLVSSAACALGNAADARVGDVGRGTLFLELVRDEVKAAVAEARRSDLQLAYAVSLDAPVSDEKDSVTFLEAAVNRIDPVFLAGRVDAVREGDVAAVVSCVRRILAEDPDDPGNRLFSAMFLDNLTFDAACARERVDPDEAEELLEQAASIVRSRLAGRFGISSEEAG